MQSKNPVFDDLANLMTNAMGAAKGVGDEIQTAFRAQGEKFVAEMDLVSREEFDVLKAMLAAQSEEIAALKTELAALKPKKPARKSSKATKSTKK